MTGSPSACAKSSSSRPSARRTPIASLWTTQPKFISVLTRYPPRKHCSTRPKRFSPTVRRWGRQASPSNDNCDILRIMARVTGIGGVFFKADDPEKLYEWYEKHLGIKREHGYVAFRWRDDGNPDTEGLTTWSILRKSSDYFDPSRATFMINYHLHDS